MQTIRDTTPISNRKHVYDVETIDGITIEYISPKERMEKPVRENMLKLIKVLREKNLPYKRIQVGTIGGFYLAGITRGRFIPLGIKWLARLLKR